MNPHRTRRLTSLAAIAAVALLAGACTGTGNAEPTLPPGTPTETTTPSPTPTQTPTVAPTVSSSPTSRDTPPPTDDELVELVTAFRNITLDLPELPVDEARQYVADTTTELTIPNGSARQLMDDVIGDTGLITRGRPYTTILDQPQPDGPEWTATGCIATRGRTTQIETGDNTDDEGFTSDYTEVDLRVAPADDGSWLLAEYDPREADDRCIPPDVLRAVEANWDQVHTLLLEWANDGQAAQGLEPVAPLVTEGYLQTLQDVVGQNTTSHDPSVETRSGFEVMFASPREVKARWCYDLSRDPSARSTENATGEITDLSQQDPFVIAATWQRVDSDWRHGTPDVLDQSEGGSCS